VATIRVTYRTAQLALFALALGLGAQRAHADRLDDLATTQNRTSTSR
jgi:hypothetical protein